MIEVKESELAGGFGRVATLAKREPVAVVTDSGVAGYLVSAQAYERLIRPHERRYPDGPYMTDEELVAALQEPLPADYPDFDDEDDRD